MFDNVKKQIVPFLVVTIMSLGQAFLQQLFYSYFSSSFGLRVEMIRTPRTQNHTQNRRVSIEGSMQFHVHLILLLTNYKNNGIGNVIIVIIFFFFSFLILISIFYTINIRVHSEKLSLISNQMDGVL